MEKQMKASDKKTLLKLLGKMRENYHLYVEDDVEVIDAIHLLQEELEYNVKVEDK